MYCQNCGHNNEDGAIFCEACGTKLENQITPQKENIYQDSFSKKRPSKRKWSAVNIVMVSFLAVLIIGLALFFGWKYYEKKSAGVDKKNIALTTNDENSNEGTETDQDFENSKDLENNSDEENDETAGDNSQGEGVDSELFSKMIGVWKYTGDDIENPDQYRVRISKTQVDFYQLNTDFLFEFEIEKAEVDNTHNKVTLTGSEYPPVMYEEELEDYEEGTYEILSKDDGMVAIKELNNVYVVELEDDKNINIYFEGYKSSYTYSHGLEEGM